MMAIGGFGLLPFYLAAVALVLALLGIGNYGKNKATAFYCWAVLAAIILEPSLAYCSSLLAALLFVSGHRLLSGCFLFSQLPVLLGPCLPVASWWSSLYASGILFVLFMLVSEKFRKISEKLTATSLVLYGIALVIATSCTWELSPVNMERAEPGYEIGAAVEKVSGRKQKGRESWFIIIKCIKMLSRKGLFIWIMTPTRIGMIPISCREDHGDRIFRLLESLYAWL